MTEKNSANARESTDTWKVIKKDILFLESVCRYLEAEGILNEMEKEIFEKMWFYKVQQEEMERNK